MNTKTYQILERMIEEHSLDMLGHKGADKWESTEYKKKGFENLIYKGIPVCRVDLQKENILLVGRRNGR